MAHRNARLSLYARRLLVERVAAGWPPARVAEQLGVSRATVYKCLRRHRDEGDAGLPRRRSGQASGDVGLVKQSDDVPAMSESASSAVDESEAVGSLDARSIAVSAGRLSLVELSTLLSGQAPPPKNGPVCLHHSAVWRHVVVQRDLCKLV